MLADRALRLVTIAFGAITLWLTVRMAQCLWLSVTPVLVRDQWFMLDELLRLHQHKLHLDYLWTPYWGHRIAIPRLLFLADRRLFHLSNAPLVILNVIAQAIACMTLIYLSQKVLRHRSCWLRVLISIVIFHLCFSSLQMENFVYGMAIQYTLGCTFAIASLVLLGFSSDSRMRLASAASLAVLATFTSAAGLVLWPVLIAESLWLRASRLTVALLAALYGALAVAYSIGFVNVGGGMGVLGFARHPLSGIWIACMVLGGPLSVFKPWVGELAGLFGIAATIYVCVTLFRRDPKSAKPRAILAAVASLFIGIAFSIVVGRMSLAFVATFNGIAPVPSRYFTFSFLFWAALLPAILAVPSAGLFRRLVRVGTIFIVAGLSIGTASWQVQESLDWVGFTRQLEAASSSFFAGADDPQRTAIIFPSQEEIDYWIPYLRTNRLSVFREPRATWIGQPVAVVAPSTHIESCSASVDKLAANGRVTGTIPATFGARYGGTDIVFTGPDNRIVGTARTTFDSHQPFPPAAYPFLGYVRTPSPVPLTAWSIGARTCRF